MVTTNTRVKRPQAVVINGVDAGGLMAASIQTGYDNILKSPFDGLAVPVRDKLTEFCRGSIVTQDFSEFYNLLIGTVGTYVFYERKSGIAEATGWIKHTITNPVIWQVNLSLNKDGYATVSFNFECKAADETKGIADFWVPLDDQSAPSYISADRGGHRVVTAVHGAANLYHITGFEFSLAGILTKESNDSDVGYSCVEIDLPYDISGSISFQDATIAAAKLKGQTLLTAAAAALVLTVKSSSGGANKTITIANVDFDNLSDNSSPDSEFTGYQLSFGIANDPDTPLTLAGDNKIIAIA